MPEAIVIVGAGGFGREAVDVVRAINAQPGGARWNIRGVLDDSPSATNLERLASLGVGFLGTVDQHLATPGDYRYVVGIGSPLLRSRVVERFDRAGHEPATLVHPAATLGSRVEIGAGSVLCAGARVTTNIVIGRHVHLNPNATVGHDTKLGDYVSMNPGSSVSGDCVLGSGVVIGVGAVVLQQITVGANAIVGANACVVRDVPADTVVKGVPAK